MAGQPLSVLHLFQTLDWCGWQSEKSCSHGAPRPGDAWRLGLLPLDTEKASLEPLGGLSERPGAHRASESQRVGTWRET